MAGWFITGTDTGIGKTRIATGLMHSLAGSGAKVAGFKPVAAGCERTPSGLRNADALALQAASSPDLDYEQVNPVALEAAIAPHIAAEEAGTPIRIDELVSACRELEARVDHVVVEGAGGWRVPLGAQEDMSDLAQALGLPVILVVGLRLGCINHALLSVDAIRARGLPLAGWVANAVDGDYPRLAENVAALEARIPAPSLGMVPYLDDRGPGAVAGYLELEELL